MVSVQYFDQNDPQSAPSNLLSPMNELFNDSLSQLRPSTSIDSFDLVAKYFEFEMDSDVESILTDSTYSDDSSFCSVDFDSENDSPVDCARPILDISLSSRQTPLCAEPKQVTKIRRSDVFDELASVISYDSLVDAKKRGIVGMSIDERLKDLQSPNQRFKKPLVQQRAEIIFDFSSDEESVYNIALKWFS